MLTECNPASMRFARLKGRDVVADFGGGKMTSDAGALLLGATDRATGLVERFSACFSDGRAADRVVHDVATLVGQRVFGIALGYEDVADHDELRRDPVLGAVPGRLEARRRDCEPLAGKSTLNRLEHAPGGFPALNSARDLAGATPETLAKALFRRTQTLRPEARRKSVVRDEAAEHEAPAERAGDSVPNLAGSSESTACANEPIAVSSVVGTDLPMRRG